MRPEQAPAPASDFWVRLAVICWTLSVLAVGVRAVVQPRSRTLYPTYETAGADWRAGADLYMHFQERAEAHLDQFRYSPLVAALLVPWTFLPERLGGALWRFCEAAVYLGGALYWMRTCLKIQAGNGGEGATTPLDRRRQGLLFLFLLPLALASLANGQVNLFVAGLLMASLAATARERWVLTAVCVALATALKIYPLSVGLLLLVCYPRRLAGPLLLALAAVAGLPFLLQHPQYVSQQYASWLHILSLDEGRRNWVPEMAYRDLWLLCRCWGVPITARVYEVLQLSLAAVCAVLCAAGKWRGLPNRRTLTMVLTLGTGWLLLLGPSIESSTFVLMAPGLGWTLLDPETPRWARWSAWSSAGLLGCCLVAGMIPKSTWFPWYPGTTWFHGLGLHPLASLLFFATALIRSAAAIGARPESLTPGNIPTARAA